MSDLSSLLVLKAGRWKSAAVVVAVFNILYLVSCFFTPSLVLLALSFAGEALLLLSNKENKSLQNVYRDISPLFSLVKVFLYCLLLGRFSLFLCFLLLEAYLLLLHRAGYYFQFLASALPCLHFKNFGKLDGLYRFIQHVDRYKQAGCIRPLVYLGTLSFLFFKGAAQTIGLTVWFCLLSGAVFSLFFLSLRYLYYIKFGSYREDLKAHAEYHAPQVIVYVSGAPGSSYQLAQWIPVLERLEQRVMVLAREKFWITELPDSPLHTVFARGMADIESFLTPETRICLYPANAFKNTQMMRRAELKHIFINHGESDKVVNVSRLLGAYTKLYLAGPMARDRLLAAGVVLREDQYAYVGRPQTSIMLKPLSGRTGTVLYAPTWEGFDAMSNYSSVGSMALELVRLLIEQCCVDVAFKPHPLTGTVQTGLKQKLEQIRTYIEDTGKGQYIESGDILEAMSHCDLMITDISSVMNDFLSTGRPFVVTNPSGIPLQKFEQQFPTVQGGYVIMEPAEIIEVLKQIAENDPKKSDRERVRKYSLGDFSCSAMEKFQQEVTLDCAEE